MSDLNVSQDPGQQPCGSRDGLDAPATAALAPCPFCGETDELYPAFHGLGGGQPHSIDCLGCGIDFVPRKNADVIAAWNRRAAPSNAELIAQRAALVEIASNLARCLLPIHMTLAEREMVGDPVPPATVVLSFMGSGASDSVTAHEITDALSAANALLTSIHAGDAS